MLLSELDYSYPDDLVALKPRRPSRVMWVESGTPKELSWPEFLQQFTSNDLIILNDTKVLPSLVVTPDGVEVHMIQPVQGKNSIGDDRGEGSKSGATQWEVLFPARDYKINEQFALTKDHQVTLKQKGLPQIIEFEKPWSEQDFFTYGKPALPPYILKLRQNRRYQKEDEQWYQSIWAEKLGSVAAPTASLHFSPQDFAVLKNKNVPIEFITLHVGMGTFLPVKTQDLNEHIMHKEWVSIPKTTIDKIKQIKSKGGKVWALGTTVTRSLEAYAQNHLQEIKSEEAAQSAFVGHTDLLIQPPYEFQIVDRLMTNFHQPKTTLLALVAAYAGLDTMKKSYQWAIDKQFQLFSYGDLSVWT